MRRKNLTDWQAEAVETVAHSVVGGAVAVHVAVRDVGGKVDGEADAHDQVDHRDGVQVDSPERHEAENSKLNGHDGKGHPERTDGVGDEDKGDDKHDEGSQPDALDGVGEDAEELVKVDEVGVEDRHVVWRLVCDGTKLPGCLTIGLVSIDGSAF